MVEVVSAAQTRTLERIKKSAFFFTSYFWWKQTSALWTPAWYGLYSLMPFAITLKKNNKTGLQMLLIDWMISVRVFNKQHIFPAVVLFKRNMISESKIGFERLILLIMLTRLHGRMLSVIAKQRNASRNSHKDIHKHTCTNQGMAFIQCRFPLRLKQSRSGH